MTKGMHILMELYGCPSEKLMYVRDVKEIVESIVKNSGLHVISFSFHQFEPHGVSGLAFLEESHIALHTWPEATYVQLDISTCGAEKNAWHAAELAVESFGPRKAVVRAFRRGLENETNIGHVEDIDVVRRKLRMRAYLDEMVRPSEAMLRAKVFKTDRNHGIHGT